MGQYTQVDPIGLAGGNPTLYGYVFNPFVDVDPFGLRCDGGNLQQIRTRKRANEVAREFGYDGAEDLKRDFVFGDGTRFNMHIDMNTGEIILVPIRDGPNVLTNLFTSFR